MVSSSKWSSDEGDKGENVNLSGSGVGDSWSCELYESANSFAVAESLGSHCLNRSSRSDTVGSF